MGIFLLFSTMPFENYRQNKKVVLHSQIQTKHSLSLEVLDVLRCFVVQVGGIPFKTLHGVICFALKLIHGTSK